MQQGLGVNRNHDQQTRSSTGGEALKDCSRTNQARIALLIGLMLLAGCNAGRREETAQPPNPAPQIQFVDITRASGITFEHWNGMSGEHYFVETVGAGGALFDMDNDGDLDIYIVQSGPLISNKAGSSAGSLPPMPAGIDGGRLYRNDLEVTADGERKLRFTDITSESGLEAHGYGMGVACGDFDNDGWVDLYLTFFGSNQFWRNCGSRGSTCFENVTQKAGVDDSYWSTSASFVDIDADGLLDLFVANYVDFRLENHRPCMSAGGRPDYCGPQSYNGQPDRLFHNRGDGTFNDITGPAGLLESPSSGLGVVAADFDRDGRIDLYVANDLRRNFLWRNLGTKDPVTFENVALERGCAVSKEGRAQASMGVVVGDLDGDGDEDLFMTHLNADYNTLYTNDGNGFFQDLSAGSGLGAMSMGSTGFGTALLDFDNDGWLDLAAANGAVTTIEAQARAGVAFPLAQTNQLFHNRGAGKFIELGAESCEAFGLMEVSRGLAAGDVDNDGLEDLLLINNHGPARLLLNRSTGANAWLGIRTLTADGKRDALGSMVALVRPDASVMWRRIGTDGSYLSSSDPRVLFGLGKNVQVSAVRVIWPDGRAEEWRNLEIGKYHTLVAGKGESISANWAHPPPPNSTSANPANTPAQ